MADEIPTDPPPPDPTVELLSRTQAWAFGELLRILEGITTNQYAKYPRAEIQSWAFQAQDAAAFNAAEAANPGSGTAEMCPFLTMLCQSQYGDTDAATRLQQVKDKVTLVTATQQQWFVIGAFVAGIRAKYNELIDAATDATAVSQLLSQLNDEVLTFRNSAGI